MQRINEKILHPELSYKICGLCFKIQNELGRYRNEKQYADAFESLLKENKVNYKREFALPASFEGEKDRRNIPDFIVEDKIIVDFKAKNIPTKEDYFQMKRYLVSYDKELGLIVNFRQKYIYPKRILNTNNL
jgi:GxxExxY protein